MSALTQLPPTAFRDLQTPCLVLDRDKVAENVRRLATRLRAMNVALRPHVKTAKCREVIAMTREAGATGITVSTLAEAEYFFDLGYTDIIYAVGITPQKLERAAALRKRGADLKLLADSVGQARVVAERARSLGVEFAVLVEINSDGLRAGVLPDDPLLLETGRALHECQGTRLAGILTHAGGSYGSKNRAEMLAMAERERRAIVQAAERLQAAGLPAPIRSLGSTPTATFGATFEGVTEVRAGVYVFHDLTMAGLGVCRTEDIALSVLCSVIGHQQGRNLLITDAGWTALSRDRSTQDQTVDQGYGLVCDEQGNPLDDLLVHSTSQEHGIVGLRSAGAIDYERFPVGTSLRILPNHACATASCHDAYVVTDRTAEVVDRWERCRGW